MVVLTLLPATWREVHSSLETMAVRRDVFIDCHLPTDDFGITHGEHWLNVYSLVGTLCLCRCSSSFGDYFHGQSQINQPRATPD